MVEERKRRQRREKKRAWCSWERKELRAVFNQKGGRGEIRPGSAAVASHPEPPFYIYI